MSLFEKILKVSSPSLHRISRRVLLLFTIAIWLAVAGPAQAEWGTSIWTLEGFHFGCTVPTTAALAGFVR
jgi:hypothetical protein